MSYSSQPFQPLRHSDPVINGIAERLGLLHHPEGGAFKETYRSKEKVFLPKYGGERNVSTSIYYLLTGETFSAFHRFKSDEIWHYYAGNSLNIYIINKDTGLLSVRRLGNPITDEEADPQIVVDANCWFAASIILNPMQIPHSQYTLVGCTVAPGFDFVDFTLANRGSLKIECPHVPTDIIDRYTR